MKTKEQTLDFLVSDRTKLGTVSGIGTTKPNMIEWFDKNVPALDLITTKSYTVLPRLGNREVIIAETGLGNFVNAVGLRNPGMEAGFLDLKNLRDRHDMRCYLNVSVSGFSLEDYIKLVKKFDSVADIIEPNFSCPNVVDDVSHVIGCNIDLIRSYVKEIRAVTDALLIPKLTPNAFNIGEIAKACIEVGADGISAINTYDPIAYREPHTGELVLFNPRGHKGGKSGEWIKDIALEKIREIRDSIGAGIPIIGMGGVSDGISVRHMRDVGADVVGVGSILSRVSPKARPLFFSSLKKDAESGSNTSYFFVSRKKVAEYKPHRIKKIIDKGENLRYVELEGRMNHDPSQFAFLWVPNVGEKPYSIAKGYPLSFVIKRRAYDPKNKRGLVSNALFELKEGDDLMVRGVYGANPKYSDKKNAFIVAGGCGISVVPKLVERLNNMGKNVTVYYGVTNEDEVLLEDEIRKYADLKVVADEGKPGRVLGVMRSDFMRGRMDEDKEKQLASKYREGHSCFYNIGPVALMDSAMALESTLGTFSTDIFSSIETNTMCGIGMCSECECGGVLTCQDGTFISLDYLKEKGIDLKDFE